MHAAFPGQLLQDFVGFPEPGIAHRPEHFTGGVKMGAEDLTPGDRLLPGRGGEGLLGRDLEHIGVAQAASADTRTVQDHHAFKEADLQNAERAQERRPDIFPELQVGFGKILILVAFPLFKDEHGIPFFGQPHGRHRPTKTAPNDDVIVHNRIQHVFSSGAVFLRIETLPFPRGSGGNAAGLTPCSALFGDRKQQAATRQPAVIRPWIKDQPAEAGTSGRVNGSDAFISR